MSAHHYSPTELGIFSIGADYDAERADAVLEKIAEATTRLGLSGPESDDLERARTLLMARWSRRMEETDGRAASLASAEALGDYRLLDREFTQLATTTADQVREVAHHFLDPDAVSAVVYLPREKGAELSAERLGETFAVTRLSGAAASSAPAPRIVPNVGRRNGNQPAAEVIAQVHHLALLGSTC